VTKKDPNRGVLNLTFLCTDEPGTEHVRKRYSMSRKVYGRHADRIFLIALGSGIDFHEDDEESEDQDPGNSGEHSQNGHSKDEEPFDDGD
jgi:hypothetical protein